MREEGCTRTEVIILPLHGGIPFGLKKNLLESTKTPTGGGDKVKS